MPRVYALKENIQKHIFHPSNRVKFNSSGWAEWPMDQFTQRRIRDGDVSLEAPKKEGEEAVKAEASSQSHRRSRQEPST